ncbi:MAG: peptidoglycan bridge formation glycyltransferase FemA/FemB family protein [Patescibacteria group bacterium]|nr:peptidoglycan bridge formation glycyltransferase FemA/FemB family protein [Patescibacteria group bacterium]MDD5490973.1 peptidoglycan bridge formation glycyltransferase FemA/FemB family protein [Patescibacteria group bacterium]
MKIVEIKDKIFWNNFVKQNGEYSAFLQSWEWGEFQKNLGRKFWRLGGEEDGQLIGVALVIKNNLPLGKSYLYIPRGPITTYNSQLETHNFLEKIIEYINDKSIIFMRFEPPQQFTIDNLQLTAKKVGAVQPEHSLILDLGKSEEELLGAMHPKTRYNIHLAEKRGVKVYFRKEKEDAENFWRLLQETASRDEFRAHDKNYYQRMLELENVYVATAEYQGKVLAANIIINWGETATYLHGASSNQERQVMAPHLLQWETIKRAKAEGYKYYDFWGIAPPGSSKAKSWAGITRFKKGFGGEEVKYPGTYDKVISAWWYQFYNLGRKVIF